jgi:hypothetical protein
VLHCHAYTHTRTHETAVSNWHYIISVNKRPKRKRKSAVIWTRRSVLVIADNKILRSYWASKTVCQCILVLCINSQEAPTIN